MNTTPPNKFEFSGEKVVLINEKSQLQICILTALLLLPLCSRLPKSWLHSCSSPDFQSCQSRCDSLSFCLQDIYNQMFHTSLLFRNGFPSGLPKFHCYSPNHMGLISQGHPHPCSPSLSLFSHVLNLVSFSVTSPLWLL